MNSHISARTTPCARASMVARLVPAEPVRRYQREQLGVSLGRYVRERRLNEAARLLQNTEMSVETVAVVTGHGGRSAFTRAFTQAKGCAPGAWRVQTREAGRDGV